MSRLFYGDNLDVLREHVAGSSVDLIYLDPPFNSNRSYNVIFDRHAAAQPGHVDENAQIQAFDDTWHWTDATEEQYQQAMRSYLPPVVAGTLAAFRQMIGAGDAMAYLVNMAPRLVELHRALKPTGSLYLHCDPTMSHYLKLLLDTIFSPACFKSEIIWKRTTAHNSAKRYGPVHDVIFYYVKNEKSFTWNPQHQDYSEGYVDSKFRYKDPGADNLYRLDNLTGSGVRNGESGLAWRTFNPTDIGRHWQMPSYCEWKYKQITGTDLTGSTIARLEELERVGLIRWPAKKGGRPEYKRYLDDMPGVPLQDVWTDVDPINARAAERLGYPTQKPLALLERIIRASSNPGDVVLDPFCGCGTTVDAAQRLDRSWVGIDITYLAVDLIANRLLHTYGEAISRTYGIYGIPRDIGAAQSLFNRSAFDFERWSVSLVNGTPNQRQVGDRGIDGVVRFFADKMGATGRNLVSVKGGRSIGPQYVRDLVGTVQTERAEMGSLITLHDPTRGMFDAVDHAGSYRWPVNGERFPLAQIITVADLLAGQRLKAPPALMPYIAADRHRPEYAQLSLM